MYQAGAKVVVTTDARGVFFGTMVEQEGTSVRLDNARNCLFWSEETKGFIGLAVTGPMKGSRVGPACLSMELAGVTSIIECTPDAVRRWEESPW